MNPRINYRFGTFVLRPAARELLQDGNGVALPSRVFDCLVYLIENRDRAVGRDELGAAVWGRADVSDAQLSQAMLRARRAIGDAGNDQAFIRTMPKFGYGWVADVEEFVEATSAPLQPSKLTDSAIVTIDAVVSEPVDADAIAAADFATSATVQDPRAGWRRLVFALVSLALVAMAAVGTWQYYRVTGKPAMEPPRAVLILPVDIDPASSAKWIHLGAIDMIADRMRMAGVPVPPSETTLALIGADVAGESSTTLRERANAAWVVNSNAMRSARGWRVKLIASNATGKIYTSEVEADDVIDAFHSCTDKLLQQLGYSPPGEPLLAHAVEEPLQRIQASLLENDTVGARQIVEQSRALADDPAEMQFQLALIDYREGHIDKAATTIKALLAEDGGSKRPWLVARAEILGGSINLMMDDANSAEQSFNQALGLLDPTLHPLDHARALAGRGAARSTLGNFEEGLQDIGAARMVLQQSGDLLAQARIDMMSGSGELLRRRPLQARVLLEASLTSLQRFGAWNERMHAYAELVQCDIQLLDYAAAEVASDSAYELMPKVANELQRAETLVYRINLRLIQGRLNETTALFDSLDALEINHARLKGLDHALRAQLAAAREDHDGTIREADEAIGLLPANENDAAAQTVLLRTRAQIEKGEVDAAAKTLESLPESLRQHPVSLAIAIASAEVAYRKRQSVEADYAAIFAQADASAVPLDQLLATESRVTQLLDEGRNDDASALLGRLAPLARQDFRFALLEVRLNHDEGKVGAWKVAFERATALAGERSIPSDLQFPPL